VDAELYRPSFTSKGKPELGCRDYPDRPLLCRVSPLEKHLTFRAQSNKDLIRNGTTNSHDFAEYFRQAYTDTPD